MLTDEMMMRAANMMKEAADSISMSAGTTNFDVQRILESMEDSTQRFEASIEKLILYLSAKTVSQVRRKT